MPFLFRGFIPTISDSSKNRINIFLLCFVTYSRFHNMLISKAKLRANLAFPHLGYSRYICKIMRPTHMLRQKLLFVCCLILLYFQITCV